MDRNLIEEKLRAFIDREVLQGQGSDLTSTTPLLTLGILDSFALFHLIQHVEQSFGVSLELETLGAEQFRDIAAIAGAIHERLPKAASGSD